MVMSGEQQYINPIIDTLFKTHQQQQDAEKLKQQREQFQAENKFREAQLAQQESEFQRKHDLEMQTLKEFHLPQLELALKGHHLNEMNALFNASKSGVGPSGLASLVGGSVQPPANLIPSGGDNGPGVTIPGGINLPGGANGQPGGSVSLADLPNPASEAARIRAQAGAQAGGVAEAQFPFQQRLAQFGFDKEKALKELDETFRDKELKQTLASHEKVSGLERGTQMAIANMHNSTQLKLGGFGLTPDEYNSRVKPLITGFATGVLRPSATNPIHGIALQTMQENGWRPLDPKDAEALKQLGTLNTIFDKLDTFADKQPENKVGAAVKGFITKHSPIPTDTQNELAQINSQALNVGRTVEGLTGRPLARQLELDLNSIASPGITKSMEKDRIKNLRDMYINKEQNVIMGGMPSTEKDLITKTYGVTAPTDNSNKPEWLRIAPKTNTNGKSLDEVKSIEIGHPVYK